MHKIDYFKNWNHFGVIIFKITLLCFCGPDSVTNMWLTHRDNVSWYRLQHSESRTTITNYLFKTQTTIRMTGKSVSLVEHTMNLLSCSISRQRQKSLSGRNVWDRWMSLVMSEFVFGEWGWGKKLEKWKVELGIEGNSQTRELLNKYVISQVSKYTSPWKWDKACQIQDIIKSCGRWY